jgi:SAM-dependent methyltransferase
MRKSAVEKAVTTTGHGSERASRYKREFWGKANLSFGTPWYRLEKSAKLIAGIADGRECSLLDIGCGPGTLESLLPPNIAYHGIDIAIHEPRPNFVEADIVDQPIVFGDRRFDLVSALGLFEYVADAQTRKFAEIAALLAGGGKFVLTYTNFAHRKTRIYEAFSNIRPMEDFSSDLRRHFMIERCFPASHNWKHSQPDKELVKAVNMRVSANVPLLSRKLAVDYFFVCSAR